MEDQFRWAGFQDRFSCFQFASSFFHLTFCGFLFSFSFCWCAIFVNCNAERTKIRQSKVIEVLYVRFLTGFKIYDHNYVLLFHSWLKFKMAHSTTEPPPTESAVVKEHLRRFKLAMYILIFIVSILANIFMLLVLWRKFRRHRKTAKSFIVLMQNLALSSLVLVIVSIPFDAVWQESDTWPFGPGGCKILWPLQTASLQAMVFTYVALAYHRFYGVSK